MPRKEFEAFTRLDASDVNTYLMDQSVMSFAGTAARGSAIATPVEGMYSHLNDTDSLQFYNGSAWTPAALATGAGLIHLKTDTFTNVSSVSVGSDADPVFSSTYDNYKIIFQSSSSTSTDRQWTMRMRSNTTDESGSVYSFANFQITASATAQNSGGANVSSGLLLGNANIAANTYSVVIELRNPFVAEITQANGSGAGGSGSFFNHTSSMFSVNNTTSYNGFTVLNQSGNFVDGTVSIYGYRKN
jgi:hypothetical protein